MKKMIIEGQHELTGEIKISGAKNSVVALIPAAILSDDEVTLYNVPNISDTKSLIDIVELLNGKVEYEDEVMKIDTTSIQNKVVPEDMAKKLRASYYFMGALLAKYNYAEIYFPGGCNIGSRPIDFHINGFKKLGAEVTIEGNKYIFKAEKLKGARIYLDFASVGATINIMLAATKAEGTTYISNAAKEPEIVNVASFLNSMGAKISGAGTSEIKIIGVKELHKGVIDVIPDRIEAGTYVIIGSLLGKNLKISGIIEEHIDALLSKLKEMGVKIKVDKNNLIINHPDKYKAINVKTLVFPGFATDLGQPMSVLLTQAEGMSIFEETIYENRMGHIKYLQKMGANIRPSEKTAIITGPTPLKGEEVVATDLRAGAAMVIAGLIAKGKTTVNDIEHILRGYENIVEKLTNVGAKISIIEE
ncbi:MAG: UDP-N-acetylglucosamine 1-carboxyvinyltransferase [Clostridia bacterium]|nr:UDP-N-acetylglucosamine 1-carboxyvinyltransferase [Clostridia bacterium]